MRLSRDEADHPYVSFKFAWMKETIAWCKDREGSWEYFYQDKLQGRGDDITRRD